MKHKKLWIFIGIIVLILILNHIFGWSSYLGNTENLKFLENMVQENLVLAAAGSAVGVGNLWRFPYLAVKDGGCRETRM